MSALRFIKSPPRPGHIPVEVWEVEWIGLSVELASKLPLSLGYLGVGQVRIFDENIHLYRNPTEMDSMNFLANMFVGLMWISRSSLLHSCQYSQPSRPCILQWLEDDVQKFRDYFAVPESIAEYLP